MIADVKLILTSVFVTAAASRVAVDRQLWLTRGQSFDRYTACYSADIHVMLTQFYQR